MPGKTDFHANLLPAKVSFLQFLQLVTRFSISVIASFSGISGGGFICRSRVVGCDGLLFASTTLDFSVLVRVRVTPASAAPIREVVPTNDRRCSFEMSCRLFVVKVLREHVCCLLVSTIHLPFLKC